MEKNNQLVVLPQNVAAMQERFAAVADTAQNLQLQNNACAAFSAVVVVNNLRQVLTEDVMNAVFMPLMNTKIGFRTDRDPNKPTKQKDGSYKAPAPYPVAVVRDCIIDAMAIGLLPTGNQFNIISGSMYPTKEGYTSLLKKVGCKYFINIGQDGKEKDAPFAEIPCQINFEYMGDKKSFTIVANVKKDAFSSYDQLKGKAERRAKKALYEYLTGCDFGDADEESSTPISKSAAERAERANSGETIDVSFESKEPAGAWREKAAQKASTDEPGF